MNTRFEEMNKKERQEYINKLNDGLIKFIREMAIKTNAIDRLNSISSHTEYRLFAESLAIELGLTKELDDLMEQIEILNILKDRI